MSAPLRAAQLLSEEEVSASAHSNPATQEAGALPVGFLFTPCPSPSSRVYRAVPLQQTQCSSHTEAGKIQGSGLCEEQLKRDLGFSLRQSFLFTQTVGKSSFLEHG